MIIELKEKMAILNHKFGKIMNSQMQSFFLAMKLTSFIIKAKRVEKCQTCSKKPQTFDKIKKIKKNHFKKLEKIAKNTKITRMLINRKIAGNRKILQVKL